MNNLKQFWSTLQTLAKHHIEYVGILIALIIVMTIGPTIRIFDAGAAPIDTGILSAIALAVVSNLIFLSVTWWIIRYIWTFFCTYSENQLVNDFNSLKPWEKIKIYLGFYLALFLSFVVALVAIL